MKKKVHQLARPQALNAYNSLSDDIDPVLRNGPGWTALSYRILLAFIFILISFSLIARVHTYADGVGFVRLGHYQQQIARQAGTIEHVLVDVGEYVVEGQILLEFYSQYEKDELKRAQEEYEAAVRRWLFQPDAENQVVQARERLNAAQIQREKFILRAAETGRINDIRVRSGQSVKPGQVLMTQGESQQSQSIHLYLPGQMRPKLAIGQRVVLEFHGHQFGHLELTLGQIDEELIGIDEARSHIGYGLGQVLALDGPIVCAVADLEAPYFEANGERYTLHEGMTAKAQVVLESEPLALAFIPDFDAQ